MPVSPGGAAARRLSALGHHMHARASSAGPQTENDVDWEVFANGCAAVTLNRPKTLNAMNTEMVITISRLLTEFESDPAVHAVFFRGAGGKAFCSGGDIKSLRDQPYPAYRRDFFSKEFKMNYRIDTYPKPIISLWEGMVYGGGVGLSVHGTFRIATDSTMFGMPEVGIGFIPDIGASHFLSKCPGSSGVYIGMVGEKAFRAPDLFFSGLATHFAPEASLASLVADVTSGDISSRAKVEAMLERFNSAPAALSNLQDNAAVIDVCFGGSAGGAEAVLERLAEAAKSGSAFAKTTLASMLTKSPTSLKATHKQLTAPDRLDLESALRMEYRVCMRICDTNDYQEGVRALGWETKKSKPPPNWQPPSLADVKDSEHVDWLFAKFENAADELNVHV